MAEENGYSEWTKEALLQHLISLMEANDKRYAERFNDIECKARESKTELREYVSDKIVAQKESIAIAMTASKEAIQKAENANERRFEGVNEFRNTLKDQQSTLLPRTEYDSGHLALTEKIAAVKERFDKHETAQVTSKETKVEAKGDTKNLWAYVVSAVALVGSMIGIIITFTQCSAL